MITASLVLYKNNLKETKNVINDLLDSPIDIIYLVDHSPDTLLSCLESISNKITYIHHINNGYGGGHNVAIKDSLSRNSKYHLILNVDICFEKNVVPVLIEYMEKNKDVGIIMPKILYPDGRLQMLCKRLPTPWDLFCKRFLPSKIVKKQIDSLCIKEFDYNHILNVPWLSGCFLLCRSEILELVRGFDESFFMYAEDIDFSRRCHNISKTVYYPFVQIVHKHKADSYHSFRMLLIHISSIIKYFKKWGLFFDNDRKRINKELDNAIYAITTANKTNIS